ncbi:Planctomycete cytochrome C [Planctomycetes bacterium Pan216]|uniref:Planctomycete cytochrome C n=1 Tax=Kolteria novifilia TaxID=2527975 RepID=A0A518AYQ0_9BACT|nr:Planctomycete cytochrome C [Planctomycetes bacterium Pan216]
MSFALPLAVSTALFAASPERPATAPTIDFGRDIRPILSDNCFSCHGPDEAERAGGFRLDLRDEVLKEADSGEHPIVPGNIASSEIIARITSDDESMLMPPSESNKHLTPAQIDLLQRWVAEGANWQEHWSFVPPTKPKPPAVTREKWLNSPIDRFILARIEAAGLSPSPEADRTTLIRRLTLDLTGLPPTPQEVDAFVNDTSPDAYEKLVDRLLGSKHFGERMAVMWLDAARYGDTSVFHADGYRDMWAWRDWVVDAYNANKPFDEFSIEQLAGDQLPNPTIEQRLATGFHRNTPTTDEGGAIAEEYRVEYVVDRVKTTATVWLGLTLECAQCHDHKYDPFSQRDYYRFYAFFNVSDDKGMQSRRGNAEPMLELFDPEKQRQLPGIRERIAAKKGEMQAVEATAATHFREWLRNQDYSQPEQPSMPAGALVHTMLDEGKGKVIAKILGDEQGTATKGTLKGNALWTEGKFNGALKFDGKTVVDLGDVGNFERSDRVSFGAWVNPEKNANGAILARMNEGNSHRGFDMLLEGRKISVHLINSWAGNAIKITTKKQLEPKKWQHVCVTYDGSSKAKGLTVYVEGEPWEATASHDRLSASILSKTPFHLGGRRSGSRLNNCAVDDVRFYDRALEALEVQTLAETDPIEPILALPAHQRSPEQVATLRRYYFLEKEPEYRSLREELDGLEKTESELKKPLTSVMVMRDMPKPRDTFVLNRGAYDAPTKEKVSAATPSMLPPMASELPSNRFGLASWLFQPDHPLTGRVAVNRYWQMLFGTGLVATPADFGSQGQFPTHPELLDWLAVDFRENGWDIKRLLKMMVMSSTYRQTSRVTPELLERDPTNKLLARGPRFRLQAEFIRDGALAISGLINLKMGGPGVRAYQPPGLWKEVGLSGRPIFKQDAGDKLYRRTLYSYWKRSAPPPNMWLFDAPTRETCTINRPRTNTPLQALVMLNDVQFVEASRNFAQRILNEAGKSTDDRLGYAFRLATSREPNSAERAALADVHAAALERYRADQSAATNLLSVGDSPRQMALDPAEHAAWTIVASTILNLDETLTKE